MATEVQVGDLGKAPVIPLVLMMAGGYLAWFGVHYWNDSLQTWPSDPVKSVLQGKGLPARSPAQSAVSILTAAESASAGNQKVKSSRRAGYGSTGSALANDALRYVGHRYSYGGYEALGTFDCSSFVNWVASHDMGLPIPGDPHGNYDGKSHGPATTEWAFFAFRTMQRVTEKEIKAGDICLWSTHMGIAIDRTSYVSAYDTASGTIVTDIASGGPRGEHGTFWRYRQSGVPGAALIPHPK